MEALLTRQRFPKKLAVPAGISFESFVGAALIARHFVSVRKIAYADGKCVLSFFYHGTPQGVKRKLLVRMEVSRFALPSALVQQHALGYAFLRLYCPELSTANSLVPR
jgi:hypothetical protein